MNPQFHHPPPFSEPMRYDFPLTPESVIIEAGTYHGQYAEAMARRYDCRIFTFEPIPEFYRLAALRLDGLPKVTLANCGLANSSRSERWKIKGDMTGRFNHEGPDQDVLLIDLLGWLEANADRLPTVIDLLALNCEGGEYELLESIIGAGDPRRFRNIMVQFHGVVTAATERKRSIQSFLSLTHTLKFYDPTYWECWMLRP